MNDDVFISEPVQDVLRLYDGLVDERAWHRTAREQVELLADRLLDGYRAQSPGAIVEIQNWLPKARGVPRDQLCRFSLSPDEARDVVARAHGFSSWSAAASEGHRQGDPVFERAVEEMLRGDINALAESLANTRDLTTRRSHYGHQATLLHYLAANGVETYRQRVPRNAPAVASVLIEYGADRLATANTYGSPHTVQALLMTSSHPALAGVARALLEVLQPER